MPTPSRRVVAGTAVAAAAVVAAVALPLFQPWRLFTDKVVDEALPGTGPISMTSSSPAPPTISGEPGPGLPKTPATPSRPTPVVERSGTFVSHEHRTVGTAAIVRLIDGTRVLRLTGLDTSDGPDLEVWLSDAEVIEGKAGWHIFDDGDYKSLGQLKGNKGNQNYVIPADVEPAGFKSVSIWCNRFNVSFGAARLAPEHS